MRFLLAALVALSLTPAMAHSHKVRVHHVLRSAEPVDSNAPALTGGGSLGYNISVLRDTD